MTDDNAMPPIPRMCRLSAAVEVRASEIEGQGLFSLRRITAGETIMILGGTLIDDVALARLRPPYSSLCVGENQNILIDPAHPVRYGNHSCDPNLWHQDAVTIVARRDIEPGAEVTIDYATHTISPGWVMQCACGSALCRRTVTGNDWRREDLRHAYGGHWTPPLLRAIAADGT